MGLPTTYLTSVKNVEGFFGAIQGGQAPGRFTQRFLESLEFKSSSDRLFVPMLKSLRFIDDSGVPTQRYFDFLDQTQAGRILAEAIQEAYSDLFQVNRKAYQMTQTEVKNKLKTLTQGKHSEAVLDKMASTFVKLSSLADWEAAAKKPSPEKEKDGPEKKPARELKDELPEFQGRFKLEHLAYNIQIHLPESRDPAVYEAIFRALKEHLLK